MLYKDADKVIQRDPNGDTVSEKKVRSKVFNTCGKEANASERT